MTQPKSTPFLFQTHGQEQEVTFAGPSFDTFQAQTRPGEHCRAVVKQEIFVQEGHNKHNLLFWAKQIQDGISDQNLVKYCAGPFLGGQKKIMSKTGNGQKGEKGEMQKKKKKCILFTFGFTGNISVGTIS